MKRLVALVVVLACAAPAQAAAPTLKFSEARRAVRSALKVLEVLFDDKGHIGRCGRNSRVKITCRAWLTGKNPCRLRASVVSESDEFVVRIRQLRC